MAAAAGPSGLRGVPLADADLDAVLELNQHWVPHVGSLERGALAALVDQSELAVGVWRDGIEGGSAAPSALDGFVIVMGPGADYRSPNYRFFSERHELFTYVDRIAVAPAAQGRGVGRLLYDLVVGHAARQGSPFVCAEVNLEPPNPDSLAFHHSMGFVDAGTQWTYDDTVQVQLLERPVDRSEPRHDRHGEAPAGSVG
ncbi:MAG: GNAT family N-acetyltransferase [Microthrixaceae bacterium]|nr:GNAT family N-acetyltransferase [Microthrixaceae bacterium]MCB1012039.1 GNAT family N-acetyltransferase [Microthrixaceae bacterium]